MPEKDGNGSKLHDVTKLQKGTKLHECKKLHERKKLHEAKFAREHKFAQGINNARRRFFTKGQFYNFARVTFLLKSKKYKKKL